MMGGSAAQLYLCITHRLGPLLKTFVPRWAYTSEGRPPGPNGGCVRRQTRENRGTAERASRHLYLALVHAREVIRPYTAKYKVIIIVSKTAKREEGGRKEGEGEAEA